MRGNLEAPIAEEAVVEEEGTESRDEMDGTRLRGEAKNCMERLDFAEGREGKEGVPAPPAVAAAVAWFIGERFEAFVFFGVISEGMAREGWSEAGVI
jgi:hypothetical protein